MAAAQPPEPGIETELRPLEFGAALTMAASWYFFGPWGIIPTVWFAYLIVRDKPRWLGATGRLLPARTRRALAETTSIAQARWRELSAPWREEAEASAAPSPPGETVAGLFAAPASSGEGAGAATAALTTASAVRRLPALVRLEELRLDPRPTAVPLGVDHDGQTRWVDLTDDALHIGVYGATGSGKDTLLSSWVALLCRRSDPRDLQLLILDGKGDWCVPQLRNLAHMRLDPVPAYEAPALAQALQVIQREARTRQALIFGHGCRSREQYIERSGQRLPLLVIVLTDLMVEISGELEENLTGLVARARALGIRVVLSMQTPTGKGMEWRANLSTLIASCLNDGSQDAPALGIREAKSLRFRPSQLPPPRQGVPATLGLFVVRHGGEQILVKAPYLATEAFDTLCAGLPRREVEPPLRGESLLNTLLNVGGTGERSTAGSGHSDAVHHRASVPPIPVTGPTQAQSSDDDALNAPPTPEEIRRLGHAIRLYAVDRSKQRAIETAFACTKGGGLTWRRASRLFDLAVAGGHATNVPPPANTDDDDVPPPFRRLSPEEE
jgi:hypothetical protein